MRSYLTSLILGVGVGVVYGIVKVRSPAPARDRSYRTSRYAGWRAGRIARQIACIKKRCPTQRGLARSY